MSLVCSCARRYSPAAGKPLWWTIDGGLAQPIFFDDNIHNDPDDSIVAVRARRDPSAPFVPLSGEHTRQLHGAILRKVYTVRAVHERDYFLKAIEEAQANLAMLKDANGGLLDELRVVLPKQA